MHTPAAPPAAHLIPKRRRVGVEFEDRFEEVLHPLPLARRGAAGPRAPRLQLRKVGVRLGGPGAAGGCPGQRGGT